MKSKEFNKESNKESTNRYKKAEWDNYWDKHASKPRLIDRIIGLVRVYFDNNYLRNLRMVSALKGKILEVGCGTSITSIKMKNKANIIYALDYSDKLKKYWEPDKVKYIIADGFDMPLKNDFFDLVWNAGVLEHFDNPKDMLKEMMRVCKKKGLICVFVPYIFDITAHLQLYGKETIYNRSMLKKLLIDAGLKNVGTKVLYSNIGMSILGYGVKQTN